MGSAGSPGTTRRISPSCSQATTHGASSVTSTPPPSSSTGSLAPGCIGVRRAHQPDHAPRPSEPQPFPNHGGGNRPLGSSAKSPFPLVSSNGVRSVKRTTSRNTQALGKTSARRRRVMAQVYVVRDAPPWTPRNRRGPADRRLPADLPAAGPVSPTIPTAVGPQPTAWPSELRQGSPAPKGSAASATSARP